MAEDLADLSSSRPIAWPTRYEQQQIASQQSSAQKIDDLANKLKETGAPPVAAGETDASGSTATERRYRIRPAGDGGRSRADGPPARALRRARSVRAAGFLIWPMHSGACKRGDAMRRAAANGTQDSGAQGGKQPPSSCSRRSSAPAERRAGTTQDARAAAQPRRNSRASSATFRRRSAGSSSASSADRRRNRSAAASAEGPGSARA